MHLSIRVLRFSVAALLSCWIVSIKADISDQLAAHWTLDGLYLNGNRVLDSTTNGFSGTNNGAVTPASGPIGDGLHFAGTKANLDFINFGRVLDPGTNSYSVSLWFKPDVVAGAVNLDNYLVAKGNTSSSTAGWSIWWKRTGEMIVRCYDGSDPTNRAGQYKPGAVTPDWHHVVMVIDRQANTIRGYFDGSNDGFLGGGGAAGGGQVTDILPVGTSITNGTANLQAGINPAGSEYTGSLDDIGIWRRALTPDEITAIYTNGLAGRDLIGQYPALAVINLSPADQSIFSTATTLAFTVLSTSGVAASNIQCVINGTDVSASLQLSGDANQRNVTFPNLSPNVIYQVQIVVTDNSARQLTKNVTFNTFSQGLRFVEAEDYNFGGGGYLDNPDIPSQIPGPNNYLDRQGQAEIDYHQLNTPAAGQDLYRIGDKVGTAVTGDTLRSNYAAAKVLDPGVNDYGTTLWLDGEWLNYTRTFTSNTYNVFARVTKSGTPSLAARLDEVTSGSDSVNQTVAALGVFGGTTPTYDLLQLSDAFGRPAAVKLDGLRTLRFTQVAGGTTLAANYFVFVPALDNSPRPPYVSEVSPLPGAQLAYSNRTAPILVRVRNGTTAITPASVQLKLDGIDITSQLQLTSTSDGLSLLGSPNPPPVAGNHTLVLVFQDNAGSPLQISNQWTFTVQAPVVAQLVSAEPTPGSPNQSYLSPITLTIMNRDTSVMTNSVQLFLNGTNQTSSLTFQAIVGGVTIVRPASVPYLMGTNLVTLRFSDGETPPNHVTNTWGFTVAGIPTSDISVGLAAHWTLDDFYLDGNRVLDSSGNEVHGTNSAGVVSAAGPIGGALHFAGTKPSLDFINYGRVLDPGSNSYSVSLWFKPDAVTGPTAPNLDNYLLLKGNTGSAVAGWSIWWKTNGHLIVRCFDGTDNTNRAGQFMANAVTPDWHHVVMVINRQTGNIRGYFNGTNDGFVGGGGGAGGGQVTDVIPMGTSIAAPTANLLAGINVANNEYTGSLDDIGIWRRALSPDEIMRIYTNGVAGRDISELSQLPAVTPRPRIISITRLGNGAVELLISTPIAPADLAVEQKADLQSPTWVTTLNVTLTSPAGNRVLAQIPASAAGRLFYRIAVK